MTKVMKMKNACFGLLLILACSCTSKDQFYQGVYEGLKNREEVVNPADDPVPPRQPSYDEYKREREEILKESR